MESCPAVRPCVYGRSGDEIPLDAALWPIVERCKRGSVAIIGGPGSGKSSAIAYLMACADRPAHVLVMDEPHPNEVRRAACERVVVYARGPTPIQDNKPFDLVEYSLAFWGVDQWLEYLLAKYPGACRSVMERIKACAGFSDVGAVPLLASIVLDEFAADRGVTDVNTALRHFLSTSLQPNESQPKALLADARTCCLNYMFGGVADTVLERLRRSAAPRRVIQSLQHPPVQLILATDRVIDDLHARRLPKYFVQRFKPRLIDCVGQAVATNHAARDQLVRIMRKKNSWRTQPTAASILTASRSGWTPEGMTPPHLALAYLREAQWKRVRLSEANLHNANLACADLRDAVLNDVRADGVNMVRALLHGALLRGAVLRRANLTGADLSYVRAESAKMGNALLNGAKLEGALLHSAGLTHADLSGANLIRANLSGADLTNANLMDADLTAASLDEAFLYGLDLRSAILAGTNFARATLVESNLEYQSNVEASFEKANLQKALLTGTTFTGANFRSACLKEAGLAEVEWEQADLRDADLTNASFHAGSSRSGLVGSPIASEGTRTGFYTDDFYEQDYMAPEEIRKANLRGADLRGAIVTETDFYLVDLRGALYDDQQEAHFRRCGAILESRVR